MEVFAGIDWSKEWHDLCVVGGDGNRLVDMRFEQSAQGFEQAWAKLKELFGDSEVLVAIERPHGPLVEFLLAKGAKVFPVNPKAADRARDRHRPSSAKSDGFDAFVLADLLRTDMARMQVLQPDSELDRELRALSRDREALVEQRTALVLKLEAALQAYYPVATKLFTDLYADIAISFLRAFPTPGAAGKLTASKVRKWLKDQHYTRPDRATEIHELLQRRPLPVDPLTVRVQSLLVVALVNQLQPLQEAIREYDRRLAKLFDDHPDSGIIGSLPGAGPSLGPKLLAELGGDRLKRVATDFVRAFAGSAPVTISSGKKSIVVCRRACSKPTRNALQQYACASVKCCEWARLYFQEMLRRGNGRSSAYRALADKWLNIIMAMLRSRTPYDEAKYLRCVAVRGASWHHGALLVAQAAQNAA